LEKLVNLLKGNTGVIFSNGDLSEVKKVLDKRQEKLPLRLDLLLQMMCGYLLAQQVLIPSKLPFSNS
jgi:ribosomal protein L10